MQLCVDEAGFQPPSLPSCPQLVQLVEDARGWMTDLLDTLIAQLQRAQAAEE